MDKLLPWVTSKERSNCLTFSLDCLSFSSTKPWLESQESSSSTKECWLCPPKTVRSEFTTWSKSRCLENYYQKTSLKFCVSKSSLKESSSSQEESILIASSFGLSKVDFCWTNCNSTQAQCLTWDTAKVFRFWSVPLGTKLFELLTFLIRNNPLKRSQSTKESETSKFPTIRDNLVSSQSAMSSKCLTSNLPS